MTEHPYLALQRAIFNRLSTSGDLWGTQVSEVVQPAWEKPYVQSYYISGGEANFLVEQDASFEIGVKVIDEDYTRALLLSARLSALLNDQGVQDRPTAALSGGSNWEIATSTQGRMIHIVEMFAQALPIYHDGWVFSFELGRI